MRQPKSFEDGAVRLERILEKISDENTPLSEALKLYSEAAELVAYCHSVLDAAQLQIEEIDARIRNSGSQEEV